MIRREFLKISMLSAAALYVSTAFSGCGSSNGKNDMNVDFIHGVASGDPLQDKVIIWTRVTPKNLKKAENDLIKVDFEVAKDKNFKNIIRKGSVDTNSKRDYTVKIDVQDLEPNTVYYYRFKCGNKTSEIGRTKTLPDSDVEKVKIAVFSCANYPNGYFNAYLAASKMDDIDVVFQLGDYIYEYGMYKEDDGVTPAYGTKNAKKIGRVLPKDNDKECLTLEDYRKRYALYHTDKGLQAIHKNFPMIAMWDDHEFADNAYKDGAVNHQPDDGKWTDRVAAAMKAYFEWVPIRPIDPTKKIYRNFKFGDLVNINTLETRIIARSKQLNYANYFKKDGTFNKAKFIQDVSSKNQVMMSNEELQWLLDNLKKSNAVWEVLAQQVLMAKTWIPVELLKEVSKLDYVKNDEEKAAVTKSIKKVLEELVAIKAKELKGQELTDEEKARINTKLPYNLDAWDGYWYQREVIFGTVKALNKNFIVLAGDTHNSWLNDLVDKNGDKVGIEFATTSVSSPGFEDYVGLKTDQDAQEFEKAITLLVDDTKYLNANNRGFIVVTFTHDKVVSEYYYMNTIDKYDDSLNTNRYYKFEKKL